jgi:hypothetical protein
VPGGTLQVPFVEPSGATHVEPRQQSPLMVQEPPAGMHGAPEHRSTPIASATHGAWSQQSSEDAQVSPDFRHSPPSALHRGTPRRSSWQQSLLAMHPQQSFRAEEIAQA